MRLGRGKAPTPNPEHARSDQQGLADQADAPARPRLGDLLVQHAGVTEKLVAEAMMLRAATD